MIEWRLSVLVFVNPGLLEKCFLWSARKILIQFDCSNYFYGKTGFLFAVHGSIGSAARQPRNSLDVGLIGRAILWVRDWKYTCRKEASLPQPIVRTPLH